MDVPELSWEWGFIILTKQQASIHPSIQMRKLLRFQLPVPPGLIPFKNTQGPRKYLSCIPVERLFLCQLITRYMRVFSIWSTFWANNHLCKYGYLVTRFEPCFNHARSTVKVHFKHTFNQLLVYSSGGSKQNNNTIKLPLYMVIMVHNKNNSIV